MENTKPIINTVNPEIILVIAPNPPEIKTPTVPSETKVITFDIIISQLILIFPIKELSCGTECNCSIIKFCACATCSGSTLISSVIVFASCGITTIIAKLITTIINNKVIKMDIPLIK